MSAALAFGLEVVYDKSWRLPSSQWMIASGKEEVEAELKCLMQRGVTHNDSFQ
jgi:hypothetical protein